LHINASRGRNNGKWGYKPQSYKLDPRMISTDIELEQRDTIIRIYALTIEADVIGKETFYIQLQQKYQKQGREVLM
jgi:hypothetical protein